MNAPIPLPDPRLAAIERRLGIVENAASVHRTRIDAIAGIIAPHPHDAEAAAYGKRGEAVVAVRDALEALSGAVRRLIETMPQ